MPKSLDRKLVRKAQSGDNEAFEALVQKYYARVYRICLGLLSHAQDAEDCAQEVFLKLYRSIGTYNATASFYTWLYRIATNACYDLLRKRRHDPDVSLDETRPGTDRTLASQLPDDGPAPDEQAEQQWTARRIRDAILRLPEPAARVIWLRDIEQWSYADIARAEQVPAGTVKSRLFRARTQLGELLREPEYGELFGSAPRLYGQDEDQNRQETGGDAT